MRVSGFVIICSLAISTTCRASDRTLNWIAVVPDSLKEAVAPLVELRKKQGAKVELIRADSFPADKTPTGKVADDLVSTQLRDELLSHETPDSRTVVVLVGCWTESPCRVPTLLGTHERMKGQWTDHGFSKPDNAGSATIAVGRLPARSPSELEQMVAKIIRFEERKPAKNNVHLLVAHPGGNSEFEKTIACNVVKAAVDRRLKMLNSVWEPTCIMDVPGAKYAVKSDEFGRKTRELFQKDHVISVYSGHSMATGIYSQNGNIFPREEFQRLDKKSSSGILVSCGCYGCQIRGPYGQGYGLYAIRSASGPVAVIGAVDESYSAMGLLAFDGLLDVMKSDKPPSTLGDYWLAVQNGITTGKIPPAEFMMHDMADGSRGKTTLATQQLEHAEMWTLLGDPAMTVPTASR